MSKFTPDHHRSRSKKSGAGSGGAGGRDLSTLQAAMMASESKVADWLAQNDPTLVRSESTEDDSKSIKSDVPVHLKRLKGTACFLSVLLGLFFVRSMGRWLLDLNQGVGSEQTEMFKSLFTASSASSFQT